MNKRAFASTLDQKLICYLCNFRMYNPLQELQKMCDNLDNPDAHIQNMQSVQTRLERMTSPRLETASEQALNREI
jgi:hypothetical protein